VLHGNAMIAAWEAGQRQHPLDRALTLLAAAHPNRSREDLSTLSIGQRDALLYELREQMFGSQLRTSVTCPECREMVELAIDTGGFRASVLASSGRAFELEAGEFKLLFRLPDTRDLKAVLGAADDRAPRLLAERCVLEVRAGDEPRSPSTLPPEVIARLAHAMEKSDPQAEVLLDLQCAYCGASWSAMLDIGMFLFAEVGRVCRRLLEEVHTLALAYKWSEADILALSPERRRVYLAMVGDG
jgi:hypothetical protein